MGERQTGTELSPKEQKRLLKKRRRVRKIILLVIEIIVLLIVLAALYVWQALNKIEKAPTSATELSASELNINEEEMSTDSIEIMKGYEYVAQ